MRVCIIYIYVYVPAVHCIADTYVLRGYAYGTRFNAHSVSYEGIRDYVYIIPQISREKTD